ncbi:MAG TPA: zinc ribbon domain-containing protein [Candidatus Acidoferrales bacterium]|nr:zinc ribbon domain-containing protein [Candidatus Acidoferrales bacterium]
MSDFPKSIGTSWNERMRLIRFRRKRERFHFWKEFKVVPGWLIATMIVLYAIALAIVLIANAVTHGALLTPHDISDQQHLVPFALAGIVTAIAIPISIILFLIGYVYRDAERRGMSPGAWTFLVIALMPAYLALGFIVYFVMREPLPFDCPQCGTKVGARFNYCPNCKWNLHPSCPQCRREVLDTDKFCSFCGQNLANPAATVAPVALSQG